MNPKAERYKSAGVDLEAANRLVEIVKEKVAQLPQKGVIGGIGAFAGLYSLDLSCCANPLLVASTDGVGTKIKIVIMADYHVSVGVDLVAMCVNDIITLGARPLLFLDYIAMGKFNEKTFSEILDGITEGCKISQCALLGGETAEMPGMYGEKDYDLAGFVVGIVDRDRVIDGSEISTGDVVIGLASNGLHSNGFSLVRRILFEEHKLSLSHVPEALGIPLGEEILKPTKIYVPTILTLLNRGEKIKGIAHITGGGLVDNIPRILPQNCKVVINKKAWEWPPIFKYLQELGNISEEEMYRVFNCGIGLVLIVKKDDELKIKEFLSACGEKCYTLGWVDRTNAEEERVVFVEG